MYPPNVYKRAPASPFPLMVSIFRHAVRHNYDGYASICFTYNSDVSYTLTGAITIREKPSPNWNHSTSRTARIEQNRSRIRTRGLAGPLPLRCGYRVYSFQVQTAVRDYHRYAPRLRATKTRVFGLYVRETPRRRGISLSLRAVMRARYLFFSRMH